MTVLNNFREKMEQKSTEELKNILVEIEDNYGDESLNTARKKALEMIKDILTKRGIDVQKLLKEKQLQEQEEKQKQKQDKEFQKQKEQQQQQEKQETDKQVNDEKNVYQQEVVRSSENTKEERYKTAWGKGKDTVQENKMAKKMEKYKALKYLPGFIKISALIFFLLVIIFNIVYQANLLISLIVIFIALIVLIPYFALSEFIILFLNMEEHARKTRQVLEKFYDNA